MSTINIIIIAILLPAVILSVLIFKRAQREEYERRNKPYLPTKDTHDDWDYGCG